MNDFNLGKTEKGFFAALGITWFIGLIFSLFIWFVALMVISDFFDWGISISDKI